MLVIYENEVMTQKKVKAEQIVDGWKKEPSRVGTYDLFHRGIGTQLGGVKTAEEETIVLTLTEELLRTWVLTSLVLSESGETISIKRHGIPMRHTTLISLRIAIDEALEFVDKRDGGD